MVCIFKCACVLRRRNVKEYVLVLISVSAASLLIKELLPEGKIKAFALFAVSVILSVAVISPIIKLKVPELQFDFDSAEYEPDISSSAEKTVRAVKGFENAFVSVSGKTITVYPNNEKLFENVQMNIHAEFVKTLLKSLYGAENVIIEGEINESD